MNKPYLIGICGGSGSGKTLFISRLKQQFSEQELCVISQDEYYKPIQHQWVDENGYENFDLPTSIDHKTFEADLAKLISGEYVEKKEYTFNNPAITPRMLVFKPAPVIVVEGIFVFHYEEIYRMLDLSVFIHTKKELKLNRKVKRDTVDRGYPLKQVLYMQENHVNPSYKKYIKPFRHEADIVIPNNERGFEKGLELISVLIKSKQEFNRHREE